MRAEKSRNEKRERIMKGGGSMSFAFAVLFSFLCFSAFGFRLASAAGRKPEFTTYQTTVLHMEKRDVTITPEEAEKIRRALEDYLTQTSDADLEKTIPREFISALPRRVEAPRVDATGQVRFGPWRLESEGDQIQVTCRLPKSDQTTAHYLLRYTAPLQENPWKVSSVTFEQISSQ